ncbi:glycosyltransferase family 4 protein [Salinimicrobium sp. WS361]|uniref:glycosyltransferase family 4 protein n=1 Tax=Salinimicrobium sp. WS361 TaxID=3425123 RepID=UPI003D6EDEBD
MKILMLSIFSPHFINWTRQLKDSGHEVYWLDVLDSKTEVKHLSFVEHLTGWRYRWDYPGRYFLKEKASYFTKIINIFNERNLQVQLEIQIKKIQPDVVHSFVMYLAGIPVLNVMKKFPGVKWIYSAWGSDMYYYQGLPKHLKGMKKTLPEINYMFADCQRDYNIARKHGFQGEFLGVFPGGGGYDFNTLDPLIKNQTDRNLILIKGYQGLHGKCISVLKAILNLKSQLGNYKIVIFGATPEVFDFVEGSSLKQFNNIKVYGNLPFDILMKIMGESIIYIGNSTSDGTPNTLLEAIVMGAFPIQSNPGGATSENIKDNFNGLLIKDPEDSSAIASTIETALNNHEMLQAGVDFNNLNIKPKLERGYIRKNVLAAYKVVENSLKTRMAENK